ncbi:Protein argonaute-3 [Beauveria bassiana D1-5]|uniref:Protein argonaute-3 n=1 Tax=Beauveria bassiana D1-5 TaxID=1245745 RepID=A0A0A2VBB1_BEABA|nr:Protein argonaute-3 [Beauveria bassiana D1-5]
MSDSRGGRGRRNHRGGRGGGDVGGGGGDDGHRNFSQGDGHRGGGYRGGGERGGGYRGGGERGGGYRGGGDRGGGERSSGQRGGGQRGGGYRGNRQGGDDTPYQGSFSAPYRERGGRGGGRPYQGGRGGGRGGGDNDDRRPKCFSAPDQSPVPDSEVTKSEDMLVKPQGDALVKRIAAGNGKSSREYKFDEPLPARPAFGTVGNNVVVWANFFEVKAQPLMLFRHGLKITKVNPEDEKNKSFSQTEVRGRKLHFVIAKLLEQIRAAPAQALKEAKTRLERAKQAEKAANGRKAAAEAKEEVKNATEAKLDAQTALNSGKLVVSEFKSQIISLKELHLDKGPIRVVLYEDAFEDGAPRREELFDVQLTDAVPVKLSEVLEYVTHMKVAENDLVFPRHPEVVDVLNMVLSFRPRSSTNVSAVGSSRLYPFGDGPDADIAMLLWDQRPLVAARGFFQSARLATGRILLNTQVTHGVFKFGGKAIELFKLMGLGPYGAGKIDMQRYDTIAALKIFSKYINKVRAVVTFETPSGRKVERFKTIQGLVVQSAMKKQKSGPGEHPDRFAKGWEVCGPEHIEFWNADDKKYVSVRQHYKTKYGMQLGNYPVFRFGQGDKISYFPAEVVMIQHGQSAKLKLDGGETKLMMQSACRPPISNAKTIVEQGRQFLGHDDPLLEQFGVSVSKQLLAVHARVMQPPMIQYLTDRKTKKYVEPAKASWNMIKCCVAKPGRRIQNWAYVQIDCHWIKPEQVDAMVVAWQNMGIDIANEPCFSKKLDAPDSIQSMDAIFKQSKSKDVQLIIFILRERDSGPLYNRIKTLGDCVYGIHTSCMVSQHLTKPQIGNFANLGIKVNLKFGGVNHKLRDELDILKKGNTMFVGYDVTHPTNMDIPKGATGPPSLVGLVSSIDSELGQWPSVTWEQASKQEMLGAVLEQHFASRIDLWQKNYKNKGKPLKNIVIYRDGVSESQFATVLTDELPLIRKACKKKFGDKPPKLTIIVSVKRHQTRFYPAQEQHMTRSGNIENGTVVDRGVTQARYWDFYLTAHDVFKGTARPAHYTVLLDEVFRPEYGLQAANELQKLTHELCYLFGRATKAVSICPPAYYADIVCERARAHRPEYAVPDDAASERSGSSMHGPAVAREIHPNLRDTMYYI